MSSTIRPARHGYDSSKLGRNRRKEHWPGVAYAECGSLGLRCDEGPITAEKILKALDAKAAGKTPRYGPGRFPDIPWPEPLEVPPPWEGGDGKARDTVNVARRL